MFKHYFAGLFLITILSGCATTSQSSYNNESTRELVMKNSGNFQDLITHYKEQLKQNDTRDTREKLATAYLDYGDPESALFTISQLNQGSPQVSSLLIQAYAEFELGDLPSSKDSAEQAYALDKQNAEIENLLGVIYAANGDLGQARDFFNLARAHFYSDIKIKNNLAVLDIIEQDYSSAIERLLPIYTNDEADDQVVANLTLAMAKSDNLELMKQVLKPKFTDKEIQQRYLSLRKLKTTQPENQLETSVTANQALFEGAR
ncbi:tetratricopeptide repeat protein [Vibrio marisflavi]|uniref:Uncharacterized protein n=1 Tax=Vibrio marisflavi CECT 7928 TaxID=634439 RepID=A0ABN8E611_9VIBR|nr:hypothetical protein [Vibrio marisflavi]CAH0540330.1 hypothetical protein VMF7928_02775 [Vibrio marisflavi CECT 7928]